MQRPPWPRTPRRPQRQRRRADQAPADQSAAAADTFSTQELEKLLAPIALYSDALLAQMLPASAYPIQIVQAQRWLDRHPDAAAKNDFSGIDNENWDPAVKALVRFPTVLKRMSDDLDWTTDLGDAAVNQPQDVADVIQALRAKADQTGALTTTQQQTVTRTTQDNRTFISIEPTQPDVIYVPTYDPVAVFNPGAAALTFGVGVAVGSIWNNNYWNWGTGAIYPPVWPGYPGWRPPYAGWRPGDPSWRPGGGNNINIGNGNNINIGNNVRPWRPGGDYRPGNGSHPGIGNNRPGTAIGQATAIAQGSRRIVRAMAAATGYQEGAATGLARGTAREPAMAQGQATGPAPEMAAIDPGRETARAVGTVLEPETAAIDRAPAMARRRKPSRSRKRRQSARRRRRQSPGARSLARRPVQPLDRTSAGPTAPR